MNKNKAIKRLAKAIECEIRQKVQGKIWELNWNPDAHVEITLTIAELRCGKYLHTGRAPLWWAKPTKKK